MSHTVLYSVRGKGKVRVKVRVKGGQERVYETELEKEVEVYRVVE